MKEEFPRLLEPADFFKRFMLRQASSATDSIPPGASYAVHKRMYEELRIWTNKILHHGRGQAQRYLLPNRAAPP